MSSKKPLLSPIHKAFRQINLYFQEQLDKTDAPLEASEAHLILFLSVYAPCRVGELQRVFGLKASTLTSILNRLETMKLISRVSNPKDRRSFLVDLTDTGEEWALECREVSTEFENEILKNTTKAQREGFYAVLKSIEDTSQIQVRE